MLQYIFRNKKADFPSTAVVWRLMYGYIRTRLKHEKENNLTCFVPKREKEKSPCSIFLPACRSREKRNFSHEDLSFLFFHTSDRGIVSFCDKYELQKLPLYFPFFPLSLHTALKTEGLLCLTGIRILLSVYFSHVGSEQKSLSFLHNPADFLPVTQGYFL